MLSFIALKKKKNLPLICMADAVGWGSGSGEEFYVFIWEFLIWGMFFWGIFIRGVIIWGMFIYEEWGMFMVMRNVYVYEECLSEVSSPDVHGSCCKSWQVGECLSGAGGRVLLKPCANDFLLLFFVI